MNEDLYHDQHNNDEMRRMEVELLFEPYLMDLNSIFSRLLDQIDVKWLKRMLKWLIR